MKRNYKNIILTGFFSLLIIGFIIGNNLYSRPQYSVMRSMGTKCTSCHVNPNYGGQRNFAGWLASTSIGIVDPSSIGLGGVWGAMANTNSVWEDRIMFGADIRFQNAKWAVSAGGDPQKWDSDNNQPGAKPEFERKFMTMQLMPYVQIKATDWLSFDASYNIAYDIHDDMRYASQQPYYASARISISEELPSLRIGYFSPSIGVDYDDHTLLIRQIAGEGRSNPLITADYAELGAELNYDGIEWLNASFGVFESKNADPEFVHTNSLSTVSNISFHPKLPYGLNTFFGVSNYFNGKLKDFDYFQRSYLNITSIYFNVGLSDRLALMTEYVISNKVYKPSDPFREVNNYLVELNYQFLEGLNVFARYEVGNTVIDGKEYDAKQYVFGTHIFPLPFIDILPEYRIYDRGDISGYSSQWAIQLHLFY